MGRAIRPRRIRAILGVDKYIVPQVLDRAWAMHNGMEADPATYVDPLPPLPAFRQLIDDLSVAQQAVRGRTVVTAVARDVQRDLLWSAMESERMYVQLLADASSSRAELIITNAGLLVAGAPSHGKALLTLRNIQPSGTVECDVNVRLMLHNEAKGPSQYRFFNWELTVNDGETFTPLPSTPHGKTTIHNLTPLTRIGVRVSMTTTDGTGPWSQTVTILVV